MVEQIWGRNTKKLWEQIFVLRTYVLSFAAYAQLKKIFETRELVKMSTEYILNREISLANSIRE